MGQAEELLNSLSEEIPVHTHPVPDTDTYFIIDPITRKIENTNRKKNVIMQYDHNSERFTFELPRYIDGHDMLECTSVTVNVDNIETGVEEPRVNSDAPDMTDLQIHPTDPEKVISSWLISRNSTQLAGIMSFHIEYKCVDSEGNVVYEWGTDTYDEITIKARKKNGEAAISEYTDVFEQWRTRIFGAGDSVMANIAAEGEAQVAAVKAESVTQQEAVELKGAQTLGTIPEDYTEVDAMAEEAVRSKADAIICSAKGESIVVSDSSDDYIRGLTIFGKTTQITTTGKNLLDDSKFVETNSQGVLVTRNNDGSFHASGTASTGYVSFVRLGQIELTAGVRYIITGTVSNMRLTLRDESSGTVYIDDNGEGASYIPSADMTAYLNIRVENGGTINATFYPMIRLATVEDSSWEPYTGGIPAPNPDYPQELVNVENPSVSIFSNNFIDVSKIERNTNISLVLSDDNYTLTATGGSDKTYAHSRYIMSEQLTSMLRGREMQLSVDSLQTTLTGTKGYVQLNIECENGTTVYPSVYNERLEHAFTVPDDATRIMVCVYTNNSQNVLASDNTTIIKGLRLTLSNDTAYDVYKPMQTIAMNYMIPGIPVNSGGNYTDANGQRWICDEIDFERGVYVQRVVKTVLDGSVPCTVITTGGENAVKSFNFGIAPFSSTSTYGIATTGNYCRHYIIDSLGYGLTYAYGYRIRFENMNPDNNTIDECMEMVTNNPITVIHNLPEPIETPLTADELAAFQALRTNYPNTTVLNDAGAWMNLRYNADTETWITNLIDEKIAAAVAKL